jgi:P4 family phage/plasmid primase-like protien
MEQASAPGPQATKDSRARGPKAIRDEIQRLCEVGLFAIPIRMSWNYGKDKKDAKGSIVELAKAKKAAQFPKWAHMTTPKSWETAINETMRKFQNANGVAILTEASGIMGIDIDVNGDDTKNPGTELWNRLVAIHGEPNTLKAKSESGGLHYYFKSNSSGLKRTRNFSTMKVDGTVFGVNGRGVGGVMFANSASYIDGQGELKTYEWLNGPPSFEACKNMPLWLTELVNNNAGECAATEEEESSSVGSEFAGFVDASGSEGVEGASSIELNPPAASSGSPHSRELLLAQFAKMQREIGNSTSTYAGSLSHGLYGTYYCYRTHGPRRCFFGHLHSGSKNFDLLKRGRNVYYRCHGENCSHKPAKKLGVLDDLKAALQDATTKPVDLYDDMQVVTLYTRGTREVQNLLLKIVVEHAAPKAYANLGRLFAYMYMLEGRILATTNEVEKSRDQLFFAWNGSSWVQDTSNLVTSVFTSQMGCLLSWYERQREKSLGALYSKHPDLKGFVVDGALKPLNSEEMSHKQSKKIKMATEVCMKERDESMPSFGKVNVQDIVDIRKCMHSAFNELHVPGLLDKFDQDRAVANTSNGLIDLRTGELLPHHHQDLCNNQTCKYIPGASTRPTARFGTFLMDVLPPSAIVWLQMFLGYCLTGETSEELFVIANGFSGANGKTTLLRALERALGGYSCVGEKAIFIKPSFRANASAASTHLMQIQTKRFVTHDESEGVEELNTSFVKQTSGGGRLNARELFCKHQTYMPQFKLCLFTNYSPHFPSDDAALIRRIVLIMFNYTFKNPDTLDKSNKWHKPIDLSLTPYLELDEGAADTLDFCVQGAAMYYAKKALAPASKVLSPIPEEFNVAAKEYAEENDKLQAFIDEACIKGSEESVTKVDFVEAFTIFLYAGGHDVRLAGDGLARAMLLKGFSQDPPKGKGRMIQKLNKSPSDRGRGFFEIRLRTNKDPVTDKDPVNEHIEEVPTDKEEGGGQSERDTR